MSTADRFQPKTFTPPASTAPQNLPTPEPEPTVEPTVEKPKTLKQGLEEAFANYSPKGIDQTTDPSKETATKRKVETVQIPTLDATAFYNARSAALARQ